MLNYNPVLLTLLKEFPAIFPRILGHEAIGAVENVGEEANEVRKGDLVIPTFMADCKDCEDCLSKKSNLCSKPPFKVSPWMPRYETSRFSDLNGEVIHHFLFVSSFSEYAVVDITHVTKIDSSVLPSRACLLSRGVSTGSSLGFLSAFSSLRFLTPRQAVVKLKLVLLIAPSNINYGFEFELATVMWAS